MGTPGRQRPSSRAMGALLRAVPTLPLVSSYLKVRGARLLEVIQIGMLNMDRFLQKVIDSGDNIAH